MKEVCRHEHGGARGEDKFATARMTRGNTIYALRNNNGTAEIVNTANGVADLAKC